MLDLANNSGAMQAWRHNREAPMTKSVAAPEIFQIPLAQLDPAIAPSGARPGTPEFEQAVIMHYALRYAEKGWQAMVTVDSGFVRVLAIPQQGMDPKDYVQGLLRAALFLAGRAFLKYRRGGGARSNVLTDFFIGAHAAVLGCAILTRDTRRYRNYFPTVALLTPDAS
jgi:hypothetical protein